MKTRHAVTLLVLLVVESLSASGRGTSQANVPRTVWSGVFAAEQAERGQQAYTVRCARCHGAALQGTQGNGLVGKDFMERWREDSVGSLYEFVSAGMPPPNRGGGRPLISVPEYLDILAYIFSQNQFPAGSEPLTTEGLDDILIQYKDGARPMPNGALVWVAGCMTGSGDIWTIGGANDLIRTRTSDTKNYDEFHAAETQSPGLQTYRLANLGFLGNAFKAQEHNGEKLLVKGNLVRQTDSTMRLSVVAVRKVADTCKSPY
jgi:mono/diheme cytochrome c family protein